MRRLLRLRLRLLWWLVAAGVARLAVCAGLHSIVEARKSGVGTDFEHGRDAKLKTRGESSSALRTFHLWILRA